MPQRTANAVPTSFSSQVNRSCGTDYKANAAATKNLWTMLVQAEPAFGKRFAADSFGATTQLLKLMARLAPHFKRTAGKEASDGKGKGKGKGEGSVPNPAHRAANKGNGKGSAKGQATPFADLNIPSFFKDKGGADMPFVDAGELQDGVCGVAHVAHNEADRLMRAYYHSDPFDLPCALLTSAGAATQLFDDRQDLVRRYAVTKIRVPVLRGNLAGK